MIVASVLERFSALRDEEILSAIDVEFCHFLNEAEPVVDERVLLAAGLTSRAYQDGSVCILLDDYAGHTIFEEAPEPLRAAAPNLAEWLKILNESPLVGTPGSFKPLILDDSNRLYLHKQWQNEQNLAEEIFKKVEASPLQADVDLLKDGLSRLFRSEGEINWQKIAAISAVYNAFTVISGGPGTGKTTTVVQLLALLAEQGRRRGAMPAIGLAAPTGKAAARLQSSVSESKKTLQADKEIIENIPSEAATLHQMLGASRHSARFRHDEDNPLPYDCIVVDEVSMIDQSLMSRLMQALPSKTRLILLGDKDQLASVEAGSVLGDICGRQHQNVFSSDMHRRINETGIPLPDTYLQPKAPPLADHIVLLQKSYRFGAESGIGRLAQTINTGDGEEAMTLLNNQKFPDVTIDSYTDYTAFEDFLYRRVEQSFSRIRSFSSPREILEHYEKFKILAAHRKGPWGVQHINRRMELRLQSKGLVPAYEKWYEGRPIIVNTNDYMLKLSNGDLGVCFRDKNGNLKIFFETEKELKEVSPSRLPDHSVAFALTVHKSQGSEFDEVYMVLPDEPTKVLSRELLYTAISRAQSSVKILGRPHVFTRAVQRTAARTSGLKDRLWKR